MKKAFLFVCITLATKISYASIQINGSTGLLANDSSKIEVPFLINSNINYEKQFNKLSIGTNLTTSIGTNLTTRNGQSINQEEAILFAKFQKFGRISAGIENPITSKLAITGYGVLEDMLIPIIASTAMQNRITSPFLPSSSGFASKQFLSQVHSPRAGYGEGVLRTTIVSARKNGAKLGTSFSPSTDDSFLNTQSKNLTSESRNITSIALNYLTELHKVTIASSILAEFGKYHGHLQKNNLESYSAGILVEYIGIKLASSIGTYKKSFYSNNLKEDSYFFDVGLGYNISSFSFGIAHLESSFEENNFHNTSLIFGKKINKNLKLTTAISTGSKSNFILIQSFSLENIFFMK